MDNKDYFSQQSQAYAAFRPTYPQALYQFIFSHLKKRQCAWDCATGNGQVARHLAPHFDTVYATDISQQQLDNAFRAKNISYIVGAAEQSNFPDHQFDLITIAQAIHWLNLLQFYHEVKRTTVAGGLLAVWGYSLPAIDPATDELLLDFYHRRVGEYWDPARRLVERHYRDLSFPFETIDCPEFYISAQWTPEQFAGYISSWSATRRYMLDKKLDPVESFRESLHSIWPSGETRPVTFPIFLKLGRVE